MDTDFKISLLVARESKTNDFWRNFVECHQMTVLTLFSQFQPLSSQGTEHIHSYDKALTISLSKKELEFSYHNEYHLSNIHRPPPLTGTSIFTGNIYESQDKAERSEVMNQPGKLKRSLRIVNSIT